MTKRIQRKRTKGWRMPPDTVYVGRPTRWGNPFPVEVYGREQAVRRYAEWLGIQAREDQHFFHPLIGKDLACWCPEYPTGDYEHCHADLLLRVVEMEEAMRD